MTTVKIRRFTSDDWNGLAGCTRFEDGSEPFIAFPIIDGCEAMVVGDARGIAVYVDHCAENTDRVWVMFTFQEKTPVFLIESAIRRIVSKVKTTDQLEEFGFELE